MDPRSVCLYVPDGLKKFKLDLFNRIAVKIKVAGGTVNFGKWQDLGNLPDNIIPIVGCSPELRGLISDWRSRGRQWIYWDRGYARRVFATWMPRGSDGGYYRWHMNNFQMQIITDRPSDRWDALATKIEPWKINPQGHIVIALPTPTYAKFHGLEGWTEKIVRSLSLITDRQLVVRDKETKRPLQKDLQGAYCLVAHGSMAAVESVLCGCPVIVHPDSAASLLGRTDLKDLERVVYPDRGPWIRSLAYCQFNEKELVDGTLWRLLA